MRRGCRVGVVNATSIFGALQEGSQTAIVRQLPSSKLYNNESDTVGGSGSTQTRTKGQTAFWTGYLISSL